MNDASFFHLLTLEGKALAPPPPAMTRNEKLAWLEENTKRHRMGAVDRTEFLEEQVQRMNNERMRSE
ncbi:hypothetical protein [Agrobacterium pusense]|uniref:hypothetical protein n=1 Tax=Agrobacterium pusense TaxID=648995 RepID=UPI0009BA171F|nr:hypothetical protein RP007_01013 [Rhizobium sp. P007]